MCPLLGWGAPLLLCTVGCTVRRRQFTSGGGGVDRALRPDPPHLCFMTQGPRSIPATHVCSAPHHGLSFSAISPLVSGRRGGGGLTCGSSQGSKTLVRRCLSVCLVSQMDPPERSGDQTDLWFESQDASVALRLCSGGPWLAQP